MMEKPFFGCMRKMHWSDQRELENIRDKYFEGGNGLDSTLIKSKPEYCTSIDKIYRVCNSPKLFAEIAVNHCLNDIDVSLAEPIVLNVVFEFTSDEVSASDHIKITNSVFAYCKKHRIDLGNCHTIISNRSSITGSIVGRRVERKVNSNASGKVIITKKLGLSIRLAEIEEEIGQDIDEFDYISHQLTQRHGPLLCSLANEILMATDVSGYGFFHALKNLADSAGVDVCIDSSKVPLCAIRSDSDFSIPHVYAGVEMRQNNVLANSEVAGPAIIFVPDNNAPYVLESFLAADFSDCRVIGEYSKKEPPSCVYIDSSVLKI